MKKCLTFALLFGFAFGSLVPFAGAAEEGKKKKKRDPEAIFKKMDKDGDGKLTEAEFVGNRKDAAADKAKKFFARLDKNKDGSVTLEEFKTRGKKKKGDK